MAGVTRRAEGESKAWRSGGPGERGMEGARLNMGQRRNEWRPERPGPEEVTRHGEEFRNLFQKHRNGGLVFEEERGELQITTVTATRTDRGGERSWGVGCSQTHGERLFHQEARMTGLGKRLDAKETLKS